MTASDRAFVALQHLLPQHTISRIVHAATRSRVPWFKNLLISSFVRGFDPDLSDAVETNPHAYASFNDFFTRALRADARPLPADPRVIACPVDGTVSQAGPIESGTLLQAKGRHYALETLLAGQRGWAERFMGGSFATIYLAPYNYHRMHMALRGTLRETWFVPGRLFSVNRATAEGVRDVFARNERVVCCFEDGALSHAMVLVGALNVGSIETVWHGEVAPRRPRRFTSLPTPAQGATLERGAEFARFNMGSTIILLLPPGAAQWHASLVHGQVVRMGEPIGTLLRDPA
jgi:phosphatidylserine decarboxylase